MDREFRGRQPLLALVWSYGLFVLIHCCQYPGAWVASRLGGTSFDEVFRDEIARGRFEHVSTILALGLTGLMLGLPLACLVTRYLWRRDFGWLGLSRRVGGILTGFGLGLILPLPVAAVLAVTGGVRVTAFPGRFSGMEIAGIVAGYLGWALYTGVVEELVFRGMAVREWAVRWGWPAATVAGGLWFGLAHLLPGLPEMAILPLAQVLLAAVAFSGLQVVLLVRRRSLWLPIGLHAGWNFTLAGILGATVSGRSRLGLFNAELSGPAWLTGGEFGLEASLVAVAVYILAAGIIWRWPDSGREPPLPLQPGPVNRPAKETQDQPDI